jgi:hypothetical protein
MSQREKFEFASSGAAAVLVLTFVILSNSVWPLVGYGVGVLWAVCMTACRDFADRERA